MQLGGFQKNTLIDFPGHIACLVFTKGCNFKCPYCHNPELLTVPTDSAMSHMPGGFVPGVPSSSTIEAHELFAFLEKRRGLLDGVAITGGEPTLQKKLGDFCFKLKNMGFDVKLDTNGSCPGVIENLLDRGLVDYVAMDIKSNLDGYGQLAGKNMDFSMIFRSMEIIMNRAPDYEFRTTCVRPFVDKSVMADIGKMIQGASLYVLQQCSRGGKMLNPGFFNGTEPWFSDEELLVFRDICNAYVDKCTVRNS